MGGTAENTPGGVGWGHILEGPEGLDESLFVYLKLMAYDGLKPFKAHIKGAAGGSWFLGN